MSEPTIQELLSRSSLGAAAWCANCLHPKDNHGGAFNCRYPVDLDDDGGPRWCHCSGFDPMSPEEWIGWRKSR